MAGPATLPPPPGPRGIRPNHRAAPKLPGSRPPPAPPARLSASSSRPASAVQPAARSCPEPGHHSGSGEDDRGAGGGNGGGMCCRLRGGGSLDLRARLCGHAHRRQLGSPIGPPGSGALGQSKGAMESGGGSAKGKGKGESGTGKGPGAGAREGRSVVRREKLEEAKERQTRQWAGWAAYSRPVCGGAVVGVALDVGILGSVLFSSGVTRALHSLWKAKRCVQAPRGVPALSLVQGRARTHWGDVHSESERDRERKGASAQVPATGRNLGRLDTYTYDTPFGVFRLGIKLLGHKVLIYRGQRR